MTTSGGPSQAEIERDHDHEHGHGHGHAGSVQSQSQSHGATGGAADPRANSKGKLVGPEGEKGAELALEGTRHTDVRPLSSPGSSPGPAGGQMDRIEVALEQLAASVTQLGQGLGASGGALHGSGGTLHGSGSIPGGSGDSAARLDASSAGKRRSPTKGSGDKSQS